MDKQEVELRKQGWSKDFPEEPAEGQILFCLMSPGYGDLRKIWNAANQDEVEDARRSFNYLVKEKRYVAYRVKPEDGNRGEVMREFDPSAGKMILTPALAGG